LKKLPSDESELLTLVERWRAEAEKTGHKITRISVAFEAGRDGFWLARWLTGPLVNNCCIFCETMILQVFRPPCQVNHRLPAPADSPRIAPLEERCKR